MISAETSSLLAAGLLLVILAWLAAAARGRWGPSNPDLPALGGIPAWRISGLNFAIWLWALWCVLIVSHLLSSPLTDGLSANSLQAIVIASMVSQGAILALQLAFLRAKSSLSPAPLNVPGMSHAQAARAGFLDFLIGLPFIFLTSFLWQLLLGWLEPDLKLQAQEPVLLFLHGGSPILIAALALLATTLAPVNEELFFRGGVYRFLKGQWSPRLALGASSLLFGAVHSNLAEFLPLVLIGALLVRTYERTGRILAPMVFHASFNAANIAILLLAPASTIAS